MYASELRNDPIARYISHGNSRPSAEKLTYLTEYLEPRTDPNSQLILADVLIDLAMRSPNESHSIIERVDDHLSNFIEEAKAGEQKSKRHHRKGTIGCAVTAALRLGELNSWDEAAEGSDIRINYPAFLLQAWEAAQYSTRFVKHDQPLLAEAVPVLLGRRARFLYGDGWISRLSLTREDRGGQEIQQMERNPNWDLGVAAYPLPEAFDQPALKVQVKTSLPPLKKIEQYDRAGVRTISSKSIGFDEPYRIIKSCVKEYSGDLTKRSSGKRFLTTYELDDLTEKVGGKMSVPQLHDCAEKGARHLLGFNRRLRAARK